MASSVTSRRRAPTMKDIAQLTGVAPSTVSRVLSGAAVSVPVSAATRERVHAIARELGYRPNPQARALRGAPTMLLGAIVRDITDPFFAAAIDALSRQARDRGYSVVLAHAREQADEALALAGVLEDRHCDAIVLIGDLSHQPRLVEDLRGVGIPVIELWQGSAPREFPLVGVDNAAGMAAVLAHLAELGHTRIAFIGDTTKADVSERRDAHRAFCTAHGLTVDDALTVPGPNTPAGAAAALDRLRALPDPPTAIAAATDVLAFGLLHRAFALGIDVPGQLSVTGFDDIPLAAVSVPPLTTVAMPVAEMVAEAIALAVASNRGNGSPRVMSPALVIRGSTGPAGR